MPVFFILVSLFLISSASCPSTSYAVQPCNLDRASAKYYPSSHKQTDRRNLVARISIMARLSAWILSPPCRSSSASYHFPLHLAPILSNWADSSPAMAALLLSGNTFEMAGNPGTREAPGWDLEVRVSSRGSSAAICRCKFPVIFSLKLLLWPPLTSSVCRYLRVWG